MPGETPDMPLDDAGALAALTSSSPDGIPYVDDEDVRAVLRLVVVSDFKVLVAAVALSQTGTRAFLPDYLDRRAGRAERPYIHPLVDPIAAETWGVPIFREQIVQMMQAMAGFSQDRAQRLQRRAASMLTPELTAEMDAFRTGAHQRHKVVPRKAVDRVLDKIMCYAPYAYPRVLAANKARAVYAAVYRKVHMGDGR